MKNVRQNAKVFALLVVVLAAVYAIHSRDDDDNPAGGLVPAAQRGALPAMSIRDLNGRAWRLSDHRGQVVLMNFWATWCPPCREETPGMVRLANSYPQGKLDILGVSMDEGRPTTVREFASQFKIPYTIAPRDDAFPMASAVQGLPTTFLIDKQGRIAKTLVGATSERVFRADVDALVHEE